MTRTRNSIAVLLAAALLSAFQAAAAEHWPKTEWQRSTPEEQGIDSAALVELYEYLANPEFQTDSVLVVRHGRIVSEAYFAPYRAGLRHDLRSVTKSVLASTIGVAIQQGKIRSIDQKMIELLPARNANSGQQAITIAHLLNMASGIQWKEAPYDETSDVIKMHRSGDWVQFVLDRPVTGEPGKRFLYSGAATHLLSAITTASTGHNAAEFARRNLFEPLGISDFVWRSDPQGNSNGESSLQLRPHDMARIGLLYARAGRWEDKQILPRGWTDAVFNDGIDTGFGPPSPPHYSRLWWTDRQARYAAAAGRHGQYIVVLPAVGVVLVTTAKTSDFNRRASIPELQRLLTQAIKSDTVLAPDARARNALAQAIEKVTAERALIGVAPPPLAATISGKTYSFEANAIGLKQFRLELTGDKPGFHMVRNNRTWEGPLRLDGFYAPPTTTDAGSFVSRGVWFNESLFVIESQWLEGSVTATYSLRFDNDGVDVTLTDGDGTRLQMRGTLRQ